MIGFGEIALLMNVPRKASVISNSADGCECWVLPLDVFKSTVQNNITQRRHINLNYLSQVSLFKDLESYERLKLLDGLQVQHLTKGQFVFNQGESGEEFYIIEQGQLECLKDKQQIRVLSEGDHFGEVAIIKNVKRTLSIRVLSESAKLLILSRETFTRILGSIKDYL